MHSVDLLALILSLHFADAQLDEAPRNPLLRNPVLRTIYLIFFLLSMLFVLVPLWAIYYVPRFNRPRRSWTVKRCVRVRWSKRLCSLVARCEIDYLGRDLSKPLVSTPFLQYTLVHVRITLAEVTAAAEVLQRTSSVLA